MLSEDLKNILRCPVELDKSLAGLSTLGVGGRAECYIEPDSIDDFREVLKLRQKLNFDLYIIGGGSNIIFPDGKISGLVLSTKKYNKFTASPCGGEDDYIVNAQAGCNLSNLVNYANKNNLGGLEFAVGIPGTLGGAVFGNAGAGGHGVAELVSEIVICDKTGELKKLSRDDFIYSYRKFEIKSYAKNEFILLSCKLNLDKNVSRELINAETERFLKLRAGQPSGRSAGCTFKNPVIKKVSHFGGDVNAVDREGKIKEGELKKESAGRLLDLCGCKGLKCGGAVVSGQHANFILNQGGASADDIMNLINICKKRVFDNTGIELEPEIKFMKIYGL